MSTANNGKERVEELLYSVALDMYQDEYDRQKKLDEKAATLVGLIGVAAALIITLIGTVVSNLSKMSGASFTAFTVLSSLELLAFAAAAIFSLRALWIRSYSTLDYDAPLLYGGQPNARELLTRNFTAFAKTNARVNHQQATELYRSFTATVIGIGLMLLTGIAVLALNQF